jgi:UDP-N-acetylglucosamine--N-acetylmuramyl-(pentapeptide) pyrophosphoryl-undecaprenol N-acetylglucosamine transferase
LNVNVVPGQNLGKDAPNILVAGGGTGGHLFPALAIADEINRLQPKAKFLFLGTKGKIEARVVPERGYAFRTIWISGFHRRLTLDNLLFPIKVIVSLVQSLFVIRQFQPDIIIGTGGYVCGPILYVGTLLGIPTVIHESNSFPGVTTRLLARRATRIFIAFEEAKRWLRRTDHVVLVGTPTRSVLGTVPGDEGRRFFHIALDRKTLFVFGGSLGATSINNAVLDSLQGLMAAGIQLVWQTGRSDYERVRNAVGETPIGWLGAFIDKMEYAFSAADLIICRAGATTIAELTRVGKPAVVVPYPQSAGDHQAHNAKSLADAGAAVMIPDKDVRSSLKETVLQLLNDQQRLNRMSEASLRLGRPEAGQEIAKTVLEMIR